MTTPMKRTQTFLVVAQLFQKLPHSSSFFPGKATGKFTAFPHMEELKGNKMEAIIIIINPRNQFVVFVFLY